MKVLSFANQKGGVGKTTSAINTAASLGVLGKQVLLVDLDPQGNSTSGVGVDKKNAGVSAFEVLVDGADINAGVRPTPFQGLWCLPATMDLAGAEILLSSGRREHALSEALSLLRHPFDYVVIDCPPSLGLLTLNGLAASEKEATSVS